MASPLRYGFVTRCYHCRAYGRREFSGARLLHIASPRHDPAACSACREQRPITRRLPLLHPRRPVRHGCSYSSDGGCVMTEKPAQSVEMIPVDLIDVVNPRVRNKKIFREITASIAELGLKKPITVTRREHLDGHRYDLVCGQGRLEAFLSLGQREIPALVINANNDDCLVMNLVENVARRQHRAVDLLRDVDGFRHRGYSETEIAAKTGLTLEYTRGVIRLLETGQQRLLRALATRQNPVS